jgi:hypothetical protein
VPHKQGQFRGVACRVKQSQFRKAWKTKEEKTVKPQKTKEDEKKEQGSGRAPYVPFFAFLRFPAPDPGRGREAAIRHRMPATPGGVLMAFWD